YCAWALQTYLGMGLLVSIVPIFILLAMVGWIIEVVVIRHLYERPLDTILATWGIGVMIQQAVRLMVGGELRYVEMPASLSSSISTFGIGESACLVFILVLSLVLFAVTWYLFQRTRFGLKVRAITQTRAVASAFGINSGRVYRMTFAYGAG